MAKVWRSQYMNELENKSQRDLVKDRVLDDVFDFVPISTTHKLRGSHEYDDLDDDLVLERASRSCVDGPYVSHDPSKTLGRSAPFSEYARSRREECEPVSSSVSTPFSIFTDSEFANDEMVRKLRDLPSRTHGSARFETPVSYTNPTTSSAYLGRITRDSHLPRTSPGSSSFTSPYLTSTKYDLDLDSDDEEIGGGDSASHVLSRYRYHPSPTTQTLRDSRMARIGGSSPSADQYERMLEKYGKVTGKTSLL